ncbi:FGGY-family carbohydrate kinase [Psychrobium sp. 1_MG-2023]|uniref:FGGY-family carbohydrate kinase n=1 Tax=Psychrobium sp. 1_MG-2023 TaxID=3062624 RepID=UPI000C34B67C|nr:FGGY-family carbohydrate kinase [Psychrobium sp. 1_MG-2023]MDP2561694.1 FGGY-family carbohydrate kinase [Psychrobium sp. 1_MG-2023]PKF57097.1 carbohydrate kinase [Alteromonadales bacterium alter-6D02]
MENNYLLSIDYGTQSVRALVFDQHGQLITKVCQPVEPYFSQQPGWAEQHSDYCWLQVCEVIKRLWQETNIVPQQICALALTTQRNCIVNLDNDNNVLRPILMWPDSRTAEQVPPLKMWWQAAFTIVGMKRRIDYFQAEAKLNWVALHQADIAKQSAKVCFLSGWLNYKLTGQLKDSIASQVGYIPFDYKCRCWAHSNAWQWQAIAVKPQQMIDVVEPGELIGEICPQAASACGLLVGTPVIAAGADKACETLTSSAAAENVASVSLGTAATIAITQSQYKEAYRYLPPYPSLAEKSFINEIILQRGFWLLTHFIEQYGSEDVIEAEDLGIKVEELICRKITHVPAGSEGLIVQPFWAPGVIYPGPEARGSIVGFTPSHTRIHLYRALIEGILLNLRQGLERLQRISPSPIDTIRISGGGSQSDIVMQMAADIFNLPCERVQTYETSGLGAAIACAKGAGFYDSVSTGAQAMVKIGQRFEPGRDSEFYQILATSAVKDLYGHIKPFYKQMNY